MPSELPLRTYGLHGRDDTMVKLLWLAAHSACLSVCLSVFSCCLSVFLFLLSIWLSTACLSSRLSVSRVRTKLKTQAPKFRL